MPFFLREAIPYSIFCYRVNGLNYTFRREESRQSEKDEKGTKE
jgi:hypothetical protein